MKREMHEHVEPLAGSLVTVDQELEREFEARLVESSTLAFRVAYGVLRHREDAEDVAQEAFAKAYRSFRQLRDREQAADGTRSARGRRPGSSPPPIR